MNPILKCFTLGAISFGMVYFLSKPALVDNNTLPPLGTFLSPKKGIWNNPLNDQLANTTQHFFAKKDSVKIHYDSNLIPHIFANNQRDLFYAQGFVTARANDESCAVSRCRNSIFAVAVVYPCLSVFIRG